MNPIQVLLVEDSLADAGVIRHIFSRLGKTQWKVAHAETLQDAIETYQESAALSKPQKFDVVLLDLRLPDSVGLETIQQFRAAVPNLPIVVLSGTNDENLAMQAVAKGAQDYLVKDHITISGLVQSIQFAIERFNAS